MQGAWVWPLVRELRFPCVSQHGPTKNIFLNKQKWKIYIYICFVQFKFFFFLNAINLVSGLEDDESFEAQAGEKLCNTVAIYQPEYHSFFSPLPQLSQTIPALSWELEILSLIPAESLTCLLHSPWNSCSSVGFSHPKRGMAEPVKVLVDQFCLTLCDPMDCNQPGSSVHGILQARTLEWVAIPFSRRPP